MSEPPAPQAQPPAANPGAQAPGRAGEAPAANPDAQGPGPAGAVPAANPGAQNPQSNHSSGPATEPLSPQDLAVLDLAGRTWTAPGPREKAIRERLAISPAAYFQLLNALLDDPRALRHAPATVNRLRAQRARFRAERSDPEP